MKRLDLTIKGYSLTVVYHLAKHGENLHYFSVLDSNTGKPNMDILRKLSIYYKPGGNYGIYTKDFEKDITKLLEMTV